ncbi:hypothetical protein OAU13_00135 [bacterium]|nr:hypothetical protein [bacterium]
MVAEVPGNKGKTKFFNLSSNEWVNDPVTHFMKSGNMLRSPANSRLSEIADVIPKNPNGSKIEYDINYGSPRGTIAGYKYTDLLTQMIYMAPCNTQIATQNMIEQIRKGATPEGHRIVEALINGLTDKYLLDEDHDLQYGDVNELVLLPGTNLIIKDSVDFEKVDQLFKDGAWVKLHPITAKVWQTMLEQKYKGRIVKNDASMYPILKRSKKVYFTLSSETGCAAVLLGKAIGLIDNKEAKVGKTFEAIYTSLDRCGVKDKLVNKFAALMSHPESGLITVHHQNKQECVQRFFNNMKKHRHITLSKKPGEEGDEIIDQELKAQGGIKQ